MALSALKERQTIFALAFKRLKELNEDPINIKQYLRITLYELEKLVAFTNYETKVSNSSIQDVTDILKAIVIETESYTPDSTMSIFVSHLEQYLGLSVKSLLIGTAIVSSD